MPGASSDGSAKGEPQSAPSPEKTPSQPLSSDDSDKLLADLDTDAKTPDAAAPEASPNSIEPSQVPAAQLLSNDDLESLLAAMDSKPADTVAEAPKPPEASSPAPQHTTNLLSNADLEKLLAGMGDATDSPVPPTASEETSPPEDSAETASPEPVPSAGVQSSELLDTDELEKLLASVKEASSKPPVPRETVEATEEPEAPVEAAPPVGKQTSELLSNADIEKLLGSMGATPEKAAEPVSAEVVPDGKQSSELLSNDDIESLLASMGDGSQDAASAPQEPAKATPPAETRTTELLSNDDIEGLLASMGDSSQDAASAPQEPAEATPPAETRTSELLSNDDIESLLASMGDSSQDAASAPQEPAEATSPAESRTPELLSNDDIEGLLASVTSGAESESAAEETAALEPAGGGTAEVLSNADLESLLSTIESGGDAPAVEETVAALEEVAPVAEPVAEVLAASETASGVPAAASAAEVKPEPPSETKKTEPEGQAEPLSQDLIESLVRGARHRQGDPERVAPPEAPPRVEVVENAAVEETSAAPAEEAPSPKQGWLSTRLAASLALGFFSGACVYLYLASHPYRAFDAAAMQELRVTVPGQALGVAEGLAEGERFSDARNELKPVLSNLPPGEARTNAEFLDTEAAIRLLPEEAKIPVLKDLIRTIDRLLAEAPNHPKAREALLWKADLLRRSEMPEAAYEVYSQILVQPDNPPGLDEGLLGAAITALQIERPNDAIGHLRRLLQAFPSSPLRDEAEYRLGDAYLAAGDMEAGRMTLTGVARAHPDSALGAEAFARLGGLSYDAGDYDEAIRLFETRLQTATKVAGNDKIYLLLARAHRVKGDLAQAERVLRELVDFFPESAQIPAALVELSQVLDGLGRRDEAVEIAKQAAQQHANNPEVLANAGHFLADTGEASAGADTLVAAEHAGAENPAVLLEAARQYRAAKELDKAAEVYQRILNDYSNSTEAFRSGIELAHVDYEKGRVRAALARMEENAANSKGRPAHAEALDALASLYDELGLRNRATETFREMAGETSDPVMLARAASTLFDSGATEDGLALAGRIDKAALPEPLAYGLLMREGGALQGTNPEQALALMEQAYLAYPNDRRPEDVQRLLDGYLALDRTAAARALVVDAEARAKADPTEIPTLEAAAARWADHLFQRGDFTAAGEAYGLAAGAAGGDAKAARSETSLWSRYQQANCLFRLENLVASLPLYEEVAGAASPWSELARAKADYVGLEMRRRGIVPPVPAPAEPAQAAPAEPVQPAREG